MEGSPSSSLLAAPSEPRPRAEEWRAGSGSAGLGPLGLEVPGGGRCHFLPGLPRGAARKTSPPVMPTLPQGGGDAQRRTLPRSTEALPEQVAVGAGAEGLALPSIGSACICWSQNTTLAIEGDPRPQRGLAEGAAGVAPASGSEWECGPAQGRNSSSPQASATPWSGLSDPRTEDARRAEGSREREQKLGI